MCTLSKLSALCPKSSVMAASRYHLLIPPQWLCMLSIVQRVNDELPYVSLKRKDNGQKYEKSYTQDDDVRVPNLKAIMFA
jgi:hypothetical protein